MPPMQRLPLPVPAISCLFRAAQRQLTWWQSGQVSTWSESPTNPLPWLSTRRLSPNPITDQALAAIAGYGVKTCPVVVHQRIEHVHAFTSGLSASESAPNGKAASEINELFEWIQGALTLDES